VVLENTFIVQLFYTPCWKNMMSKATDRPIDWDFRRIQIACLFWGYFP